MKKLSILLVFSVLIILSLNLYAQVGDEFVLEEIVVTSEENPLPPITLIKLADFVALNCTITNDTREEEKRKEEIYETLKIMAEEAEKTKTIEIKSGVYVIKKDDYEIDLQSDGGRPDVSTVYIGLKTPIKEKDTLASLQSKLKKFAAKAKLIGRTELDVGGFGISVVNPEKYRYELINKIFSDISKIKENSKTELNISILGLDKRLRIRRYSPKEIELYLNYNFVISSGNTTNFINIENQ